MEFFPEINLSDAEAEIMALGMFAVARADGRLHEREAAMVRSFYGEVVGGDATRLAALETTADLDPSVAAAGLSNREAARMFVKSCLLLAYADGTYGPKERALIEKYATALSVAREELGHMEQSVKEYLVGHLTKIADSASVAAVARELKV